MDIKKVLTIAGSDSSGGAGIQADIKTITSLGMYAESAITALTAQNTTGVYGIWDTSPEFVKKQIDCIFEDIRPDAVKIGMVSNSEIISAIHERLTYYRAENIVVDPVMVSTSGSRLLSQDAMDMLMEKLLPIGTVITPNIPEAEVLCGFVIKNKDDMVKAAEKIADMISGAVLIKGGHNVDTETDEAADLLYNKGSIRWFVSPKIDNPNTHGTGCTLSSAIACKLAEGKTLEESVGEAKEYLNRALSAGLDIGKGAGPLLHNYMLV